jgi:hypothetical protein
VWAESLGLQRGACSCEHVHAVLCHIGAGLRPEKSWLSLQNLQFPLLLLADASWSWECRSLDPCHAPRIHPPGHLPLFPDPLPVGRSKGQGHHLARNTAETSHKA